MKRIGLIGKLTVVANLGDSKMRARLAKGTSNVLGFHDVRVAAGSDGGRRNEDLSSDPSMIQTPYMASEQELDEREGHELIFAAMREAKSGMRKVAFVCCSALTDMAAVLRDPRWDTLAPDVVSHIVHMGGARSVAQGLPLAVAATRSAREPAVPSS